MPSFQAPESGVWGGIKNAVSSAASTATSTAQSAGSAVSDWLGMGDDAPFGPVIGPQFPLEDLYGEDNGDTPFGLLTEEQIREINTPGSGGGAPSDDSGLPFGLLDEEQIREINTPGSGGGASSPYGDDTVIPFVPPSYDDMIVY